MAMVYEARLLLRYSVENRENYATRDGAAAFLLLRSSSHSLVNFRTADIPIRKQTVELSIHINSLVALLHQYLQY